MSHRSQAFPVGLAHASYCVAATTSHCHVGMPQKPWITLGPDATHGPPAQPTPRPLLGFSPCGHGRLRLTPHHYPRVEIPSVITLREFLPLSNVAQTYIFYTCVYEPLLTNIFILEIRISKINLKNKNRVTKHK